MPIQSPHELCQDWCAATLNIRERHGARTAIDYLVGEKLPTLAQLGETHPEFLAELPALAEQIRKLFTRAELEAHFERTNNAARIDPDILKGASEAEIADFQDVIDDARRERARRDWLRAMLLRTGS
jgi:hypothetical protein